MRKKPTRKQSYFTMKPAMTAILCDASGKMHHGILFDRRLSYTLASFPVLCVIFGFVKISLNFVVKYSVAVTFFLLPVEQPTNTYNSRLNSPPTRTTLFAKSTAGTTSDQQKLTGETSKSQGNSQDSTTFFLPTSSGS